jgi:hypothetical protein
MDLFRCGSRPVSQSSNIGGRSGTFQSLRTMRTRKTLWEMNCQNTQGIYMKITSYDRPSSAHSVPYAIYQLAQAQIQIPDRRYPDLHFYHAIYPMSTFPSAPQPIRSPFTSSGTSINSELGALPSSPSLLSENSLSYATPSATARRCLHPTSI